jgi:5-methylcytosine-specific restriction endonuclease McrA
MNIPCIYYVGEIVTLKQAKNTNRKRYFTGSPCKHNHISERQTTNRRCLACEKEDITGWRANNKDKSCEYTSSWRSRNKDCVLTYSREYKKNNKDKLQQDEKDRWVKNKSALQDKAKKYREENKELFATYARNRRAKLKGLDPHTKNDIFSILEKQKYKCAYCSLNLKNACYDIDHILPLALGGGNAPKNLQATCPRCNRRKNKMHPNDFAREMGFLI